MPERKALLIAPVPGRNEKIPSPVVQPGACSIWGQVSGNPLTAAQQVRKAGYSFEKIIYSVKGNGASPDLNPSPTLRRLLLEQASHLFDLVELDWETDTLSDLLNRIPPEMRIIAATVVPTSLAALIALFEQMATVKARFYKITVCAEKSGQELLPLALLRQLGREDVIAYADGPIGAWTRLVAPSLGSPAIYTTLEENALSDGALPIRSLVLDYHLPELFYWKELYGIAGNPVFKSLSPRLHNAAYREFDLPAFFVPFHIDNYEDFHREVVHSPLLSFLEFEIKGLTVVSPFKEEGYEVADKVTHPISGITRSCNLLTKKEKSWVADSTDPLAIVEALDRLGVEPKNLRAAIVGCGGAGRAIAATLLGVGARVTMFNRGQARGVMASRQLNIPFEQLEQLDPGQFDILVNATPLGKQPFELPFDPHQVSSSAVFIDYAYGKHTTPAIKVLRERKIGCVDGREVLIIQVRRQFEVMTGEAMPEALALQQAFELELTISSKNIA